MKDVNLIVKDKEGNLLNHRCYLHFSDNTIEVRLMEESCQDEEALDYKTTISDNPIHDYQKAIIIKEYAKTIIEDLLNNSDEYARQRAIDFLKKEEEDD